MKEGARINQYYLKAYTFTLFFFCILVVQAQQEKPAIVTDRPDQSNTPVLTPKGALQIESGFVVEVDGKDALKATNYTYNSSLFKYGLNQNVELQLGLSYLGTQQGIEGLAAQGISPASLGLKLKLADEIGFWPQAALVSHINFNTTNNEFSSNNTYADLTLTCSHTLSSWWSLTYNAGAKWNGTDPEGIYIYTLSNGFSLSDKLGFFIELYGFFPEILPADHRLDGGFTFKITPLVQVDVSGGVGLQTHAPDFFLGTGIAARFFK